MKNSEKNNDLSNHKKHSRIAIAAIKISSFVFVCSICLLFYTKQFSSDNVGNPEFIILIILILILMDLIAIVLAFVSLFKKNVNKKSAVWSVLISIVVALFMFSLVPIMNNAASQFLRNMPWSPCPCGEEDHFFH